ncbi:MAG: acyl-CoA dehydrogenase family protein [Solirubrobacterales bacterium]
MNRRWPDEAVDFGEAVGASLARLGGVEFTRRAEADPSLRESELRPALEQLGFHEIDVLGSPADAMAAALAARAAGAVVAPWPVAAQLAAPLGADSPPAVYAAAGPLTRLEHLDLFESAAAVDLETRASVRVAPLGAVRSMPLDPFGVPCQTLEANGSGAADPTLARALDAHTVLIAYYVLGALEVATDLAAQYAGERVQFGQPIAQFGAIQWRLSEVVVARDGLVELAGDALWRFTEGIATPADTLALRLGMLEAAHLVLAQTHQVFGAIGLCEEHDVTVIDRHLQPLLRRPAGTVASSKLLRDQILAHGFDGLFSIAPKGVARPQAEVNG